ncbi:hypothetical protein VFPBJ_01740 [Purpureocillium lilacinum]|uniref:Uncharacterized protein n=1 Tax=Purpureocillium lilacinum TaxID=33203 RepID=A0A179HDU6_PURLI|nr:hypothetical protein VFPBJ_01740 [Purpureocillium lilacinum]
MGLDRALCDSNCSPRSCILGTVSTPEALPGTRDKFPSSPGSTPYYSTQPSTATQLRQWTHPHQLAQRTRRRPLPSLNNPVSSSPCRPFSRIMSSSAKDLPRPCFPRFPQPPGTDPVSP